MDDSTGEALEHREHAEHAAHSGDRTLVTVSATIAILAVVAATVGSLEEVESGAAISKKSASVLLQNQATDRWSYYQAQSLKRHMYEIAGDEDRTTKGERLRERAKHYGDEAEDIKLQAEDLEHRSEAVLEQGEHREHRHHVLTVGATLLHVSIAVATLSIIMRGNRWPWYASMALGAVGTAVAGYAYLA